MAIGKSEVKDFVDTPLWDGLDSFLRHKHKIKPKIAYSGCSMDNGIWKGWNVKYQKSGKSLCTLYPKQGYIQALVPVSLPDVNEVELMLVTFAEYTQNLIKTSVTGRNGKSLAFIVEDDIVLQDMKHIISLRAAKR